jgi:hypothetical protein
MPLSVVVGRLQCFSKTLSKIGSLQCLERKAPFRRKLVKNAENSDHTIVYERKAPFSPKIGEKRQNSDHNIV